MIILKIILIPVSILYSMVTFARNIFYDYGIFKITKLNKPVISVGNITTGGTGKTPLTIFIAKYFLRKNIKTGIISRGYKRNSAETVTVCDGSKMISNACNSGDELAMISEELLKEHKNLFYVVAGNDRVKAGNYLLNKFDADVVILDDGFQHRKIHRDLDITIIDAADYFKNIISNIFTLPSGNLREYYSGFKRADVIVQNNKADNFEVITQLENYGKEIVRMRYKTEYFMDNKNSILKNNSSINHNAIVFSGIANDDSFIRMIKDEGIIVRMIFKFPDHHNYRSDDIYSLTKGFTADNIYITTEKDFVKIKEFGEFANNYPVYFMKIKTEFTHGGNTLINFLDKTVNENRDYKI